MSFAVAPDAYDRFMGRYSAQLAPQLADFAGVHAGQRAVDVGCGPGALTGELLERLGPDAVSAADPSESFVFMANPVLGLREMARVTRQGGVVAACVWDHAGERSPLTVFWRAVRQLRPEGHDESDLAGAREGHLAELFREAGLRQIEDTALAVQVGYASFEDWWEPFTLGVGPAGVYVRGLDDDGRGALQERCRLLLPEAPFTLDAHAWAARGVS